MARTSLRLRPKFKEILNQFKPFLSEKGLLKCSELFLHKKLKKFNNMCKNYFVTPAYIYALYLPKNKIPISAGKTSDSANKYCKCPNFACSCIRNNTIPAIVTAYVPENLHVQTCNRLPKQLSVQKLHIISKNHGFMCKIFRNSYFSPGFREYIYIYMNIVSRAAFFLFQNLFSLIIDEVSELKQGHVFMEK